MKDMIRKGFTANQVIMNKNSNDRTSIAIEEEIEHLKTQFSKTQASNDAAWNSSVLRVLFKNESFARKYKTKIERFLKDLLEEGEEFIVYHPTHNNDEKEFEENHQTFHIDKVNGSFDNTDNMQKVPVYLSTYEDTLHCEQEITPEEVEDEKPSMFTCFNCLGDHHMKKCPDKLDWPRINVNKKEILLSGSTIRYHTEDQNNGLKPGIISDNLRDALGLKQNQLPKFIYHMRVIGYPPGWMEEAVFEKSGLYLFDTDGKALKDEPSSPEAGTVYDGTKFIDFPGFNSPVPEGFIDEWMSLDMPPLQPHQQLKEALKSPNIINKNNTCKRRQSVPDDNVDLKKYRNEEFPSPLPKASISEKKLTSPECSRKSFDFKTPDPKQKRQSMSISMSPGTPVLDQSNPYQRLPDADKFAQGITEHLPFENLPDSVGTYEKMRGVISCVQKKLNGIKNS